MPYEFGGPRSRASLPWDRVLSILPLAFLGLGLLILALSSVYTVAPHEKAVVLRFGKYLRTVEPGLQFRIPLVDQVLKVSVEERSLRLPYAAGAERPARTPEDDTLMLTGDLNAASVEWTIQWKVAQPDDFLFRFHQPGDERFPEQMITTVAQTVMNRLVGDYSIDEVLTEKRGEIGEEARQAMQRILDGYACGVAISDLQMQRVSPPEKVRPSFDQVNASIQQRDQLENEANKERNKLRPKALAEKDKAVREAEGYADRRRAESRGEIEALLAKYHAYQRAPEVTRQRLYLEAMQDVLRQVESKVVLDSELQSHLLPLLPLDHGAKP
jgi:membrane protease subunit HflK